MFDWGWGGHMGWMGLGWVLILAVIVAAIWIAARGASGPAPPAESPEATLKQRYARGEIGREEYEQKLADLRK